MSPGSKNYKCTNSGVRKEAKPKVRNACLFKWFSSCQHSSFQHYQLIRAAQTRDSDAFKPALYRLRCVQGHASCNNYSDRRESGNLSNRSFVLVAWTTVDCISWAWLHFWSYASVTTWVYCVCRSTSFQLVARVHFNRTSNEVTMSLIH